MSRKRLGKCSGQESDGHDGKSFGKSLSTNWRCPEIEIELDLRPRDPKLEGLFFV